MTQYSHLTDDELVRQLLTRDDLTELERVLLNRLIVVLDELASWQDELKITQEAGFGVHD
jgi:hypothetical protein